MAHFPGWCLASPCSGIILQRTADSSQTVKLSPSPAHPKRELGGRSVCSFCLLFPDGPLTVIDAFLTGPRLIEYYEQLTRCSTFPPLSRFQIETYIAPCYRSLFSLVAAISSSFFSAVAERRITYNVPLHPQRRLFHSTRVRVSFFTRFRESSWDYDTFEKRWRAK